MPTEPSASFRWRSIAITLIQVRTQVCSDTLATDLVSASRRSGRHVYIQALKNPRTLWTLALFAYGATDPIAETVPLRRYGVEQNVIRAVRRFVL